jgi:hypothetical protein
MQESCGDRRIDAARQAADHPLVADRAAELLDRLLGEVAQFPGAGATADGMEEVAQDHPPLGRMSHLGMKL